MTRSSVSAHSIFFAGSVAFGCGVPANPDAATAADTAPRPTDALAGADAPTRLDTTDAGAVPTDAATDAARDVRVSDSGPPATSVFPADRLIAWQGNVGVEGGVPTRTTIRNCVTSDAVPTDGTTDATAAIQRCLAATPDNGVAFLPAGSYRITARISVPARRSLRGAGSVENAARGLRATTIYTRTAMHELLYIGAGSANNTTLLPIASGHTRGGSTLTLSDATSLAAGDYVLINELNDSTIPVSAVSYADGTCTWCDQFGATRLRAQVGRVAGRTGNAITLAQPLFYTFSAANQPRVMRLNRFVERAGIEDLVVRNDPAVTGGWNINIMIEGAANSWVRNVTVDTCGKRCIDLRTYYYRIEVRDSLIQHCINHADSDTCYGTEYAEGSSSLIENNIYHDVSEGPLLMWGASGNVVAYNYSDAVFRTHDRASWFWPTSWTHGAHPSYNLWEGNVMAGINWDGYWGSASHNIAFRNRLTSHDPAAGLTPGHVEVAALIMETNNHYMSVVGNVLGEAGWTNGYEQLGTRYWSENLIYATGTGAPAGDPRCFSTAFRHMNYDFAGRTTRRCGQSGEPPCQGSGGGTTLPASLYLPDRPSWFGDVAFPPIDPGSPMTADLPARRRYLTLR